MRATYQEMLAAVKAGDREKVESVFRVAEMKETVRRMLDAGGGGMPVEVEFSLSEGRHPKHAIDIAVRTGNLLPMFGPYGQHLWVLAKVRSSLRSHEAEAGTYKTVAGNHLNPDELALVKGEDAPTMPFACVRLDWVFTNASGAEWRVNFGWLRFNEPHNFGRWSARRCDGREIGGLFDVLDA